MKLRIKYERERLGFTQLNVATIIGVHQPVYCDIENGRRKPTAVQRQKLVDLFRIPSDELFVPVVVIREPEVV